MPPETINIPRQTYDICKSEIYLKAIIHIFEKTHALHSVQPVQVAVQAYCTHFSGTIIYCTIQKGNSIQVAQIYARKNMYFESIYTNMVTINSW